MRTTKSPLSQSEREHLADACAYLDAVKGGLRPAAAIAERRGISIRTAEGRISRAEAMGFLTPARRGQRERVLTRRAYACSATAQSWCSLVRLIGGGIDQVKGEVWVRYDLWDRWAAELRAPISGGGPTTIGLWGWIEMPGHPLDSTALAAIPTYAALTEFDRLRTEALNGSC